MICTAAEVRETHTGIVFLAGEYAYKAKKPVDFGFCDFSTLAARHAACEREVALNARLAPDVYLGVAQLAKPGQVGTEPLVMMRRMPDAARVAARVGDLSETELRNIARLLAAFHDRCERGPSIDADGTREALAARWIANLDRARRFCGSVLEGSAVAEIEHEAHRYVAGRGPLFEARIAAGNVVDGHGDLLADDIFLLPDGPRILDCLEFDDALRHLDRIDDIAFLAMDLERLGAPTAAARLLSWYRDYTGDLAPNSLVHHYIAYRAFVRAEVTCLRHEQGDPTAAATARRLTELARTHLATGAVQLVLVGGAPGTGKSTVAAALGDELGYATLHSDRVRKEIAGLDPETPAPAAYRSGLYDPAQTRRTYTELAARAERLLAHGESVVLDASWTLAADRSLATAVAARTHSRLVALRCEAPPAVAAARMAGRRGPSDADPAIAAALRAETDPWPEAYPIETVGTPEHALAQARGCITDAHNSDRLVGASS